MADSTYPIFVGPGGSEPVGHVRAISAAVQPTVGDALHAGQTLRTNIRQRTAAGVDVDGMPFVAYSEGYRQRKIALLGHADAVDLFGPSSHPHMLNTMMIRAGGTELPVGVDASADPIANNSPAGLFHLGFYSEEATRAQVHNEGAVMLTRYGTGKNPRKARGKATFSMPRRHFFDANGADIDLMGFSIRERMLARAAMGKR